MSNSLSGLIKFKRCSAWSLVCFVGAACSAEPEPNDPADTFSNSDAEHRDVAAVSGNDASIEVKPSLCSESRDCPSTGNACQEASCNNGVCEASSNSRCMAFGVEWQLEGIGASPGRHVSCSDAGTPVVLVAVRDLSGEVFSSYRFPCTALHGTTGLYPPGRYSITMKLLGVDDVAVSSITIPVAPNSFDGNRGDQPFDLGVVAFSIQSFVAKWRITESPKPTVAVSCESVGASIVELKAIPSLMRSPSVFRFPCSPLLGVSPAIPLGEYALQFRLLTAAGVSLSQTELNFRPPADSRAFLPEVNFQVPGP